MNLTKHQPHTDLCLNFVDECMHSHHLGGGMQFYKTDNLLYHFIAKPFWCEYLQSYIL